MQLCEMQDSKGSLKSELRQPKKQKICKNKKLNNQNEPQK